jgi:hypothetical protein
VINGTIHPILGDRLTNDKDADWFERQRLAKLRAGYTHHVAIVVERMHWGNVARHAAGLIVLAMRKSWNGTNPGEVVSTNSISAELAIKIAEKLQINDVEFVLI